MAVTRELIRELDLIVAGEHSDPHRVLGLHDGKVRAYRPDAVAMRVVLKSNGDGSNGPRPGVGLGPHVPEEPGVGAPGGSGEAARSRVHSMCGHWGRGDKTNGCGEQASRSVPGSM